MRPVLHLIRHQNCSFKSPGFIDQRSIVLYLNRKDLTAQAIHDDLVATPFSAAASPHIDELDEAILRALEEFPFSSVRQILYATHLPKTTVYRRLSGKLAFAAR
jgi:hypothetical protein